MTRNLIRQAFDLIPFSYKRKAPWLIFLLIIGSFFDLFSLASFIPLIVLVFDPLRITTNSYVAELQISTGLTNPVHLGIALTLVAMVLTLIKTQLNVWVTFRKASFAYHVAGDLASQALASFFQIPFRGYTGMDYTKEMNRISNLPLTFANNIIIPCGTIISELLIAIALILVIAFFEFYLFIFILCIISPMGLLYLRKRKKIREISSVIKLTYPKLLKYTLQAIEGLTEIKIFRKENFFKKRFALTYDTLGKTFATDHTTHTSSARTTEVIIAICIGVLVIYTLLTRKSAEESILLLTLYAGASFRMMPSLNRIFSTSLQIRTHEYVVHELTEMLAREKEQSRNAAQPLPFYERIEIQNLSFHFENQPWVLRNASLTIRKGEKIALIGKSGIGKTTLLMLLIRFLNNHEGEILVDSKKITNHNQVSWQKLLGYVPQAPYILDASVLENIAFGVDTENIDVDKIKRIINDLDLETWISNLPNGVNTIIGEKGAKISGGQRQRLAIARSLYHDAEILLLDEITNQLDKSTELEIMRALENLSKENKTIILITHRPELWKFFDSIYELKDGAFEKIKSKTMQTSSYDV